MEHVYVLSVQLLPPDDTTEVDTANAALPPLVAPYSYALAEGSGTVNIRVKNIMPPATYCFDLRGMITTKVGLVLGKI